MQRKEDLVRAVPSVQQSGHQPPLRVSAGLGRVVAWVILVSYLDIVSLLLVPNELAAKPTLSSRRLLTPPFLDYRCFQ